MSEFDKFLDQLKSELAGIAKDAQKDIKDELIQDGKEFAESLKKDLLRWSSLLENEKLTREEFKFLLEAKKDLATMEALKQKGLAQARIDKIKNTLIGAVIGSAVRTLS